MAGKSYSKIILRFSTVAGDSVVIPINDVNKIVGDRIQIVLTGHTASIILYYELIKTKFSEYGQAEKTLTRVLRD